MAEIISHILQHEDECKEGVEVVVAICGEVGFIMSDATLYPDTFDFYSPPWQHKATCKPCRLGHARNLQRAGRLLIVEALTNSLRIGDG